MSVVIRMKENISNSSGLCKPLTVVYEIYLANIKTFPASSINGSLERLNEERVRNRESGGEAVRGWQQPALSDCSRMCVDTLCLGQLVIGSLSGKVETSRRRRRGANTRLTDT